MGSELVTSEGRLAIAGIVTAIITSMSSLNTWIQAIVIIAAAALVWKYMDTREKIKTINQ